jgi:hypothetical protein
MRLRVAKFEKQRRAMNNNFDLVSPDQNSIARFGQTPTRRRPIRLSYRPRMVLRRQRPGEGRAYAHQIGSQQCDLNLGVVLAVEDDGLLGFCETEDGTNLLQPGDLLRRTWRC